MGLGRRLLRAVLHELRLLGIGDIGLLATPGTSGFFECAPAALTD